MKAIRLSPNDIEITFEPGEAEKFSHQGDCHDDCLSAIRGGALAELEGDLRPFLRPMGGWDKEELLSASDEEVLVRILWIAAVDAVDSGDDVVYLSDY